MSPELRVLLAPASTFRELAASSDRGAWTLLRRPLFLMFAMGLTLSLASSTRVSFRAVVDGMISFTFLPVSAALAAGVVYLRGDRRVPFARVVDGFLLSNAPWLLWILAFCIWQAALSPAVMSDTTGDLLVASFLVPVCWAAYLDLQFIHIVLLREGSVAVTDLVITRVIGWTCAIGYFFGIAGWAQIVAWFR